MTTPNSFDDSLDEILDKVYGAGLIAGERYTKGKGAGTLASDAMYQAKQALKSLYQKHLNTARLDELHMAHTHVDYGIDGVSNNYIIHRLEELAPYEYTIIDDPVTHQESLMIRGSWLEASDEEREKLMEKK